MGRRCPGPSHLLQSSHTRRKYQSTDSEAVLSLYVPNKGSQRIDFPVCSWICGTVAPQVIQPPNRQGGLAVNPIPLTILLVDDYYGDGVYRSTDGGDSWAVSLAGASTCA